MREYSGMTPDQIIATFDDLIYVIHDLALKKGWWQEEREMGTMLALIHSEVSEALEADRTDANSEKIPEFTGLEEELADVIIRILDLAGYYDLRIGQAVLAKHEYNLGRSFRHGNKKY